MFGVESNPILFCSLDENRIKVDEFERERVGLRNGEMTNKEFFHGRLSGCRQIIRKNCLFGMTQLPPGGCEVLLLVLHGVAKLKKLFFWKILLDIMHDVGYNGGN